MAPRRDRGLDADVAGGTALFTFVSRRTFLKIGLGAGGLVLAGGGGLLALRGSAPEVKGLKVLSNQAYRTLANLARTDLPEGGPFPPGADDVHLARAFDAYLADEPANNVKDLGHALTLVELGPILFGDHLATFSHLSPADRLTYFRGWATSDLLLKRQASVAFRKFFGLVFYDKPVVWPHIGYPGPSYYGMPKK